MFFSVINSKCQLRIILSRRLRSHFRCRHHGAAVPSGRARRGADSDVAGAAAGDGDGHGVARVVDRGGDDRFRLGCGHHRKQTERRQRSEDAAWICGKGQTRAFRDMQIRGRSLIFMISADEKLTNSYFDREQLTRTFFEGILERRLEEGDCASLGFCLISIKKIKNKTSDHKIVSIRYITCQNSLNE